jgi:diguanylate cyclase (GGDEF)-like protein
VLSAWPFVLVLVTQTSFATFSVYTLSTIRAYLTNETNWTRNEYQATYLLSRLIDTDEARYREGFRRAIAVPLAYRRARRALDQQHPDLGVVRSALLEADASSEDIPKLIWMFRNFRGISFLETSIARWTETDPFILALARLGDDDSQAGASADPAKLKSEFESIELAIAPRALAFSSALNDGARVVEWLLAIANIAFAGVLAALTVWRVGAVLRQRQVIGEKLMWQASHDELTGLGNRRALVDHLAQCLTSLRNHEHRGCALIFIDLDQFKVINDTCGHAAGDALLGQVCGVIRAKLRPSDFFARFGGDEFNIVMADIDASSATEAAERVRIAVEDLKFLWAGRRFPMTASIGLVHDQAGLVTPEAMMSNADVACFMAKEKGRNRIHSLAEGDHELLSRRREMDWVQRIHQAIEENRFCLFAQEIAPLGRTGGEGHHLEVLIRMRDDSGNIVPPSSFLPAAERFGLMKLIDRWVISSTFHILAARRATLEPPITCCAINLSGATIGDSDFLDFLRNAFKTFDVPPRSICFEITETNAILNLEAAKSFMKDLRDLGCAFSLDDFGSGMSSFNYLKELHVDYIKIDGAFVKNLLIDRADRAMIEMICHVGHIMGKKIIAECVELEVQYTALREIGIDYGQGFGISKPKPFGPLFRFDSSIQTPQNVGAAPLVSSISPSRRRRPA